MVEPRPQRQTPGSLLWRYASSYFCVSFVYSDRSNTNRVVFGPSVLLLIYYCGGRGGLLFCKSLRSVLKWPSRECDHQTAERVGSPSQTECRGVVVLHRSKDPSHPSCSGADAHYLQLPGDLWLRGHFCTTGLIAPNGGRFLREWTDCGAERQLEFTLEPQRFHVLRELHQQEGRRGAGG